MLGTGGAMTARAVNGEDMRIDRGVRRYTHPGGERGDCCRERDANAKSKLVGHGVSSDRSGLVPGQGEAQSRLRRSRAVSRGASRSGQLSRPTTLLVSEVAPK